MCIASNNDICKSAKPNTTDWKSIKWNKVNRHVTSLQRRIYRASKDNNKKKVRDLQRHKDKEEYFENRRTTFCF